MENLKIILGQDIGNGYMKGSAKADGLDVTEIDYQSTVALAINPVSFKVEPDNTTEVERTINDIFNNMDASFNSPLITTRYNYIFGSRAIAEYPDGVDQFDVSNLRESKARVELSYILLLGTIAGLALKSYYAINKKLPDEAINTTVDVALALPINEYIQEKDEYPNILKQCSRHVVQIHNFKVPQNTIDINISFGEITVLAEGSAAQLAIVKSDKEFLEGLLDEARKTNDMLDNIKVEDIIKNVNSVGIDIGEGTVNYPVFINGSFSAKLSHTLYKGYGSVLDNAIEELANETGSKKHIYSNRKELNDFLTLDIYKRATTENQRKIANLKLAEQRMIFSKEITQVLARLLSKVGVVDVVYVYGGAADVMKDELYKKLITIVANANPNAPVLYMDEKHCRILNRDGLFKCALMKSNKQANANNSPKKK